MHDEDRESGDRPSGERGPLTGAIAEERARLQSLESREREIRSLRERERDLEVECIAADAALRQQMGISDLRFLVAVRADSLEAVLEATENVEARLDHAIAADEFRRMLASDAALCSAVLVRVVRRLRGLSSQLVEATALSAPARVAARLVRLADLAQLPDAGHAELELPITQEELGQWAGLSREGTVKGIAQLRSRGLIETARRRVTVLDMGGLRAEASVASS